MAAVLPVDNRTDDQKNLALMMSQTTLGGAIKLAKPAMDDTANEDSAGFAQLGIWGMKNMRWVQLEVPENETSVALVQKDPDEARGKRLCAPGTIVQIELQKTAMGKGFIGLFMTDGGNLLRFFVVGSTGTLVGQSHGRICGVVTGKYDYSNSAGGVGHAVAVVGMFDLPENRNGAPPAAKAAPPSSPAVVLHAGPARPHRTDTDPAETAQP